MNATYKSYAAVLEQLKSVDEPQCFTVNYLPDTGEYELWIGNQPYYIYDRWIEESEKANKHLKKEIKNLKAQVYDLTHQSHH